MHKPNNLLESDVAEELSWIRSSTTAASRCRPTPDASR